ncbi:FecR domain-containing protein [Pseudomonas sp. PDM11]|uniref:FecR domain-containing protein n=1 Tax=Pseudomonas sp. PDM11 TaxID=2769309 RepID=UPI00177E2F83|nr:FecR domain-containing protein [Pseudomonas sp. PDM11]MBD9400197.1 FecR domain-containing protein [Pseudomonas sp. PDM11]
MAPDHAALQQAAEWFAVLADPPVSAQQQRAWQQWLAARPEHAAAWQRVEAISSQFARLPADTRRRAAAQALRSPARSRRQVLGLFAVLGGAGLLAAAGQGRPWRAWLASERTGTGEIRDLRLVDGSHLWLGSRTAVDIDYSASSRLLRLLQGEILLDTAKDPRPLLLDTLHGRLQALGTRFSVREGEGFTQLSVFAGAVRIEPSGARGAQLLQAGQQVRFSADAISTSEPADPARQTWSRGVLMANDRRLGDFIAELADYVPGYLGCDPRVADLRLVGAYPLGDTERILDALAGILPIRVNRRLPWWVTVEPLTG